MDTAANFFESIRLGETEDTWLENCFRAELPAILTGITGRKDYVRDICPLADIGEYILRVLQIHSLFANHLIYGPFIREHTSSKLATLVDEDDGSTIDYIDSKHQALKYYNSCRHKLFGY